jgi:galactose-6-phosphate isomerase
MLYIASDKKGLELKEKLADALLTRSIDFVDLTTDGDSFMDAANRVCDHVLENRQVNKGIIIDEYGTGSFMTAVKRKYIICAQCSDEHSAKMTRDHNNANVITMGAGIIGYDVALRIALRFCKAAYSGGRHQIRVDMLDKMGKEESL